MRALLPIALSALLFSAANAELTAPARGSVGGPWALVDSAFLYASQRSGFADSVVLGGDLAFIGGLGFELAGVRFSPTARFSIGPRAFSSSSPTATNGLRVSWSSLSLAIAAPDLINDTTVTGLRLTPVVGATVPTTPLAFEGAVPFTVVSVAAQLERRFGVLELAYRLGGNSTPCLERRSVNQGGVILPPSQAFGCISTWSVTNGLFAEAWLGHSVSVALGTRWLVTWLVPPRQPSCAAGTPCDISAAIREPRHTLSAEALVTWAFTERFGTTLELGLAHSPSPFTAFGLVSSPTVGGSLSVWFRTDPVIERNWLDR